MSPYYDDPLVTLYLGDCLEVMPELEAESVDCVVTDPPYGLGFMGKRWDHGVPIRDFWEEMLRLTKPGGYMLAFGGTRTVHRIATNIEDAGWIIRDMLTWIYASGFPKGRANLKPAHEPIVLARKPGKLRELNIEETRIPSAPDDTNGFETHPGTAAFGGKGWGGGYTHERQGAGRWPSNILLSDPELFDEPNPGVVGSGAVVNTQATRNDYSGERSLFGGTLAGGHGREYLGDSGGYSRFFLIPSRYNGTCASCGLAISAGQTSYQLSPSANTAPSGAPTSPDGMPDSTAPASTATTGDAITTGEPENPSSNDDGESTPNTLRSKRRGTSPESTPPSSPAKSPDAASPATGTTTTTADRWMCGTCAAAITSPTTSDSDGLPEPYPRAFLIPKADRAERERGLAGAPTSDERRFGRGGVIPSAKTPESPSGVPTPRANVHPTVKPIDLMRHLVRLVTPPGGVVLDPFLGSGTTCLAASEEGFKCIGIEREAEYLEIAKGRLMATPMGMGLDVPAGTKPRKVGKDKGGGTHCSYFPDPCEGHPGHGKYGPTIHVRGEEPAA